MVQFYSKVCSGRDALLLLHFIAVTMLINAAGSTLVAALLWVSLYVEVVLLRLALTECPSVLNRDEFSPRRLGTKSS